jgi:hypothetical protein
MNLSEPKTIDDPNYDNNLKDLIPGFNLFPFIHVIIIYSDLIFNCYTIECL